MSLILFIKNGLVEAILLLRIVIVSLLRRFCYLIHKLKYLQLFLSNELLTHLLLHLIETQYLLLNAVLLLDSCRVFETVSLLIVCSLLIYGLLLTRCLHDSLLSKRGFSITIKFFVIFFFIHTEGRLE